MYADEEIIRERMEAFGGDRVSAAEVAKEFHNEFRCEYCGYWFITTTSKRSHKKRSHPSQQAEEERARDQECVDLQAKYWAGKQ